jgi:uncharacterized protein YbjT (DUF2867 family)
MIVVTTPTGQIGSQLVGELGAAAEPIRVIVRDASKLRSDLPANTEVIEGSHGDMATIDRALDGADALFWCVPPTPIGTMEEAYSGFTRSAAEAVARHSTPHVVAVSALGRGTVWEDRAGLVTASLRMVDLFRRTGAAVRGLAMPGFMENTLMQLDAIRAGQLFGPIDPGRKLPHTATRDMASAAARLLTDRSWSGHDDLPVLGPDDLSFDEIAAIISDVVGYQVRYQAVPFDAFGKQLLDRNVPEDFANGYVAMMRAKNEGMDNVVARTPATTGATSFQTWAENVLKPMIVG